MSLSVMFVLVAVAFIPGSLVWLMPTGALDATPADAWRAAGRLVQRVRGSKGAR